MFNFDRSITFCFGVSSNLSQQKSPTAEILRIYFLGTIVRRKYLPKISAVGLFSCDKFEETPKQKVIDLSKFKIFYFSSILYKQNLEVFLIQHQKNLRKRCLLSFLLQEKGHHYIEIQFRLKTCDARSTRFSSLSTFVWALLFLLIYPHGTGRTN